MQLMVFGGGEEPIPDTRTHGQIRVRNPAVAETQCRADGDDFRGCAEQRENDRCTEAQSQELGGMGTI